MPNEFPCPQSESFIAQPCGTDTVLMHRAASCYSTDRNRIENKLGNELEKFIKPELFDKPIENEAKCSTCGLAPQFVAPEHASHCGREAEILFDARCFA